MKKNTIQKNKIFNIYSQNLTWVKSHPEIRFEPDFTEGYICPLCFTLFFRESLSKNYSNPLTIEHNPPSSLGGKDTILTCKECNSKTGHQIDSHLLKRLEDQDFFSFQTTSSKRVRISNEGKMVNGDFSIDKNGEIIINILKNQSNPLHVDHFFSKIKHNLKFDSPRFNSNSITSRIPQQLDLNLRFRTEVKSKLADVALLKIAYLKAFEIFGNGFLTNPFLEIVREQILNPSKNIISGPYGIDIETPEKILGINIITQPKQLRSFLVVFELKTKIRKQYYAIILPGHGLPGFDIYKNLGEFTNDKEKIKFKIEMLNQYQYLKSKDLAFSSLKFWNILTKD